MKHIRYFTDGINEYEALDPQVKRNLSFVDYFHLKEKYKGVELHLEEGNHIRVGITIDWQGR